MTLHLGLASRHEIPECARILAEALADDPVLHTFVGTGADRVERLTFCSPACCEPGHLPPE